MAEEIKYSEEQKQLLNEIVTKQREIKEAYGEQSAEFKRYVDQSDESMKKLDEKQEEIVKQLAEKQKIEDEQKKRIEHLESLVASTKNPEKKQNPHQVANALFTKNWRGFAESNPQEAKEFVDETEKLLKLQGNDTPAEVKTFENGIYQLKATNDIQRTDIGEAGGFLVPMIWSNTLREQIIEYNPMRRFATVETLAGKSIMMPIRQGVGTATWEGEAETNTDNSIVNYTTEELTPHRLSRTVSITWEMLNNSMYNVSQRIMNDVTKAFSVAEGLAYVSGNGIKKPLGFTVDPNVPIYSSATSTLTFDDVIGV
ncbi:MAG TPA: phage major capsid protein, partial [Candidatus Glassbacteria bacterium]|nr:phage major capsid protein [Candidatus Glassbacteria bacterium]